MPQVLHPNLCENLLVKKALMNKMYIVIDYTYVYIYVCSIRKVRIEFGAI